jgi:hypothetical protein
VVKAGSRLDTFKFPSRRRGQKSIDPETRDLEEMMSARGVMVDPIRAAHTNASWLVGEAYVKVAGQWAYLTPREPISVASSQARCHLNKNRRSRAMLISRAFTSYVFALLSMNAQADVAVRIEVQPGKIAVVPDARTNISGAPTPTQPRPSSQGKL